MSRIKLNERVALGCIHDAECLVDLLFSSMGMKFTNPNLVELRRLAVFGQALLLLEGRAQEWRVRPADAAATLRRLVTPTAKEQARTIAERATGTLRGTLDDELKRGAAPAVATNQTVRELVDAEGSGS